MKHWQSIKKELPEFKEKALVLGRMKAKIRIIIICLVTAISCSRNQTITIIGKVTNPAFEGSQVYIIGPDGAGERNEDSAIVSNGSFRFRLIADIMALRSIHIPVLDRDAVEDVIFVKEPGTLEVIMSESSKSKGTRTSEILMNWKRMNIVYDSTQNDLYYMSGIPGISQVKRDSIIKVSADIDSQYLAGITQIISDNTDNGAGLFLFKMYYDHLPLEIRRNILVSYGEEFVEYDLGLWSKVMFDKEIPKENGSINWDAISKH